MYRINKLTFFLMLSFIFTPLLIVPEKSIASFEEEMSQGTEAFADQIAAAAEQTAKEVSVEKYNSAYKNCEESRKAFMEQCLLGKLNENKRQFALWKESPFDQETAQHEGLSKEQKIKNLHTFQESAKKTKNEAKELLNSCNTKIKSLSCEKPLLDPQQIAMETYQKMIKLDARISMNMSGPKSSKILMSRIQRAIPITEPTPFADPNPIPGDSSGYARLIGRIEYAKKIATGTASAAKDTFEQIQADHQEIDNRISQAIASIEDSHQDGESRKMLPTAGTNPPPGPQSEPPLGGGQAKEESDGGLFDGLSLGKVGGALPGLISKFMGGGKGSNNNNPYPSDPKRRQRYPTDSGTNSTNSYNPPRNNIAGNDDGGPDYLNPDDNLENIQNKTGQNLKAQYPSPAGRGLSGSGSSGNNASRGTAPRSSSTRRRSSSGNTALFGKAKSTGSASGFYSGKPYGLSKTNSSNFKKSSNTRKKGFSTFDPRKYIPSEKLKRRAYERMTGRKIAALSSSSPGKRVPWPCYILKTGDPKIPLSIFRVQRIRIRDIINNRKKERSCEKH